MKENQKRASSFGSLTLVKSPAVDKDESMKKNLAEKRGAEDKPYSQWVNYHYSYTEFIHSYVEHVNTLRRSKDNSRNSKVLRLFKPTL